MGWVLLAAAMFIVLLEMVRCLRNGVGPRELGLDFANSPEKVEMTLRSLALYVEQGAIYDLTVYIAAEDAEARTIALRLGQYLPLRLLPDPLPGKNFIKANDLSPKRVRQEVLSRLVAHWRQAEQ